MGLGVRFLYQLPRLTGGEVKTLIGKNALVILVVLAAYAGRGVFICHPVERRETVRDVHRWNVLSKGEASLRLIILESQLSYPVKKSTLTDDTFSVWVDEQEIPPLKAAGKTAGDAKYYFKKVEDLLCKNAFVVNLPRRVFIQLSGSSEVDLDKTPMGNIAKALNGKITVRYNPAWQVRSWVEGVLNTARHLLSRYELKP
jgi:hypothetical protein